MRNEPRIGLRSPWLAGLLAVLLVFLGMMLYYMRLYPLMLLPFLLVGAFFVIYYPKPLLIFLVFATPLSFSFENLGGFGGIGFYFPTEPLLFGIMLLYIIKLISGMRESKKFLRHPLTIAILINVSWIALTAAASTMPVVSFKFLLSRMWFILVIYFMINHFFKDEKFIYKFIKAYIIGLTVAIIYTLFAHARNGFSETAAHWVMWPFFKDHTSYGAIIALIYPLVIYALYRSKKMSFERFLSFGIFVIFTIGLILSYTRAAWVSLVGAMVVWALIKLRIDFKVVLLGGLMITGFYFGFEEQILHKLESNRQDSSGNIGEHVQSITNISSDASNLERLNRWNSAIKMFQEKPILGFGPGTYMFTYGRYQKSSDKTIISTNYGDGGNAHSEYLGPLSEQGLPGALSILAVFIISLVTGIRLYYQLDHNPYLKGVVLCMVLGLVTYYLHGILNNYLDTDKASVPIWGMLSMIVAIQIYHLKDTDYLNRQQSNAVSSK
ncbi:O-antigen ligase family protein [Cryomorpha ignava]|uniref:O-antigen ligase family protein n=1 Tax=Cryomorpha ignava TaxID=101383 RepID=A0A7K3WUY6_9FLAO|nr:O-antigen ligase family protein [Cryomorpha ignava]NEN25467.1 O-antigen ligase family protein [Cryomorpha ignava]